MKLDKKSDVNSFFTCNFVERNNYEKFICNNHKVAFL